MTTVGTVARRGGGWVPLLGVAALTDTVVILALPMVLGRTLDAIVSGQDTARWLTLSGVLVAVGVACDVVDAYAVPAAMARSTAWLRRRLVDHLLAVGPSGARRFDTGDLVSRVSSNAADAGQAGPGVVLATTGALPAVGSVLLLGWIDPWLAVSFLVALALVAGVLWTFTRRSAEMMGEYQRSQGELAARLVESLDGARTVAAAGTLDRERHRVLQPLPALRAAGMGFWRVFARSDAQVAVVAPLAMLSVLVVGGLALVADRITPGELFAASRYAVIGAGLGTLTGALGRLARSRAGVRRADEVLRCEPVRHGDAALPPGPGTVEFRGVTARDGDATLLDDVHLTVPGGACVAVVGRSGAGKSVLAAVAARLRDPDAGQVLLDGVPLERLSHDALRAAVGCAFERPVLVGATVGDAIRMGRDPDRTLHAARATRAHDFVSRLPEGYATDLASAPMSGGEAQRLGLARAWHAERLLVLDDATSSLDMVTEMRIRDALAADHGRRTRLVVTHRASTAAQADLVVWLDAGQVRAVGTHRELRHFPAYREVFG